MSVFFIFLFFMHYLLPSLLLFLEPPHAAPSRPPQARRWRPCPATAAWWRRLPCLGCELRPLHPFPDAAHPLLRPELPSPPDLPAPLALSTPQPPPPPSSAPCSAASPPCGGRGKLPPLDLPRQVPSARTPPRAAPLLLRFACLTPAATGRAHPLAKPATACCSFAGAGHHGPRIYSPLAVGCSVPLLPFAVHPCCPLVAGRAAPLLAPHRQAAPQLARVDGRKKTGSGTK
jgi:hypothetical protein